MAFDRPSGSSERPDDPRDGRPVPEISRVPRRPDDSDSPEEFSAGVLHRVGPTRAKVPERLRKEVGALSARQERGSPYGPSRLLVGATGGGDVRVGGWVSPARIVHATRSRDVVVGNGCRLERTEHHHFDRVSVAMDGILGDPAVKNALRNLVRDGFTPAGDRAFVTALRRTLPPRDDAGAPADLPLAGRSGSVVTRSGVVQVGDRSRLKTEVPIHVRETVLPGAELLVGSRELRESLVAAIREEEPAGPAMQAFLTGLLEAAGSTDLLRILQFAAESGIHDASVFGLFGFTQVSDAGVVLAGAGNTLIQDVEVDVRQFRSEDLQTVVRSLQKGFGPVRRTRSPEPPPPLPRFRITRNRPGPRPEPSPPPLLITRSRPKPEPEPPRVSPTLSLGWPPSARPSRKRVARRPEAEEVIEDPARQPPDPSDERFDMPGPGEW